MLLVCGIANPKPLKDYLHNKTHTYYELNFSDHHIFNIDDLNNIKKKFEAIDYKNKIILTTEKDAVRFVKFDKELSELPIYDLPITHKFLFNEGEAFDASILSYIRNHYKNKHVEIKT